MVGFNELLYNFMMILRSSLLFLATLYIDFIVVALSTIYNIRSVFGSKTLISVMIQN